MTAITIGLVTPVFDRWVYVLKVLKFHSVFPNAIALPHNLGTTNVVQLGTSNASDPGNVQVKN